MTFLRIRCHGTDLICCYDSVLSWHEHRPDPWAMCIYTASPLYIDPHTTSFVNYTQSPRTSYLDSRHVLWHSLLKFTGNFELFTSLRSVCNGTSPVTVRMSRWNTRQEFCRILPNSTNSIEFWQILPTQLNSDKFYELDWILPNSANLIEFWQVLASSAKAWLEDCVCAHALTTKTSDYLVMRFLRYSFLFFTQRLILYKSYTLRFR